MVRYFILFCLIASQADAQSIAVSGGGGSIVTSGNAVSVEKPKEHVKPPVLKTLSETRLEDLEMRLDFLESTLKAATEKPVVVTKPSVELVIHPKKQRKYLAMFTAKHCGWCQVWKRNEKNKIERAGFQVVEYDMGLDLNVRKYGDSRREKRCVSSLPAFAIIDADTGEWLSEQIVGSTPADTLLPMLGEPVKQTVVTQSKTEYVPQPISRLPVVNTQWGTIDLETYNRNCNCSMCRGIRALQQQYRAAGQYRTMSYEPDLPPEQQPTPQDIVEEMVSLMQLTKDDVLADLGCGHDARILIHAVKATGCRGVGIEIDPVAAESARRSVSDAGLSGLISINPEQNGNSCSDALEFVPERHGVTAITAYLYPELLNKLAPKMQSVRVSASPYHQAFPGMVQHGDVWIWRK